MARLCLGYVTKGEKNGKNWKNTNLKRELGKEALRKEIAKKLENPNLSNAERNKLIDKLYDGIEFKKV